jgi:hypothetical protein
MHNLIGTLKQELLQKKELVIKAKITPKSGRCEIAGALADGTIKIKLKSAPEQGKANEELIELLAEELGIPKRNMAIISGHTSPVKKILITL